MAGREGRGMAGRQRRGRSAGQLKGPLNPNLYLMSQGGEESRAGASLVPQPQGEEWQQLRGTGTAVGGHGAAHGWLLAAGVGSTSSSGQL